MLALIFSKNDSIFRKNDSIFDKNASIFNKNDSIFGKNASIIDKIAVSMRMNILFIKMPGAFTTKINGNY